MNAVAIAALELFASHLNTEADQTNNTSICAPIHAHNQRVIQMHEVTAVYESPSGPVALTTWEAVVCLCRGSVSTTQSESQGTSLSLSI